MSDRPVRWLVSFEVRSPPGHSHPYRWLAALLKSLGRAWGLVHRGTVELPLKGVGTTPPEPKEGDDRA